MQPLNNYMLVEPLESPKQTAGGLFLPDTVKQKPAWFRVQQVGPGLPDMLGWLQQLDHEPGDLVYVLPHSVYQADLKAYGLDSDQQVTVVSEGDVLAKIRDGDGDVLSRTEPIGSYCIIQRIVLPEQKTAGGLLAARRSSLVCRLYQPICVHRTGHVELGTSMDGSRCVGVSLPGGDRLYQ